MALRRTIIIGICVAIAFAGLISFVDTAHAQAPGIENLPPGTRTYITGGDIASAAAEIGGDCSLNPFTWPTCILERVGQMLISILGMVLWVSAKFFDLAVNISVVNFKAFAETDAIREAWKVSRDFANLFFIFILLYVAIGTILRLNGIDTRKMVVNVIVIALLINFSAVLTGVVIDAGNVLAYQFFKLLHNNQTADGTNQTVGISEQFASVLALQGSFVEPKEGDLTGEGGMGGVIIRNLGQSALIIITSFVFFAAAILFMARMVLLIFIIVISPFAFLAYAFPTQEKHFTRWLNTLINETFFAPAYLFLTFLVLTIIKTPGFADFQQIQGAGLSGYGMNAIANIIKYTLVIGLMLVTLVVARSMGAAGMKYAEKWSKRFHGAIAANTLGRAGAAVANSKRLQNAAAGGGAIGGAANALRNVGKFGAKSDFGIGVKSFEDRVKRRVERKNMGDYAGDLAAQKQIFSRMSNAQKMEYYRGLKAEDRAKLKASSIDDTRLAGTMERMRAKLPNAKEIKDTEKELVLAKAEKDVSDGLKMLKDENGAIPEIGDDGKVKRDAYGAIIRATEATRDKNLKKFVKLIKPSKDTANAIADVLNFDGTEEEKRTSQMLVESLSNLQINRLLKDDTIDAMKDSEKKIKGISETIGALPDDNKLKEYVRSVPAFSSLLGIKKLDKSKDTASAEHLALLRKSRAEMEQEVANDPELVEINRKIAMHAGSDYQLPIDRDNLTNTLILNKQKAALDAISVKDAASLAPLLAVDTPEAKAHTETLLKNVSVAKAEKIAQGFTGEQQRAFDEKYKEETPDPYLAERLGKLGVKYKGSEEAAAAAAATQRPQPTPGIIVNIGGGGGAAPQTTTSSSPKITPLDRFLGPIPSASSPAPTVNGGASETRTESQAIDLTNVEGAIPKKNPVMGEEERAWRALEQGIKEAETGKLVEDRKTEELRRATEAKQNETSKTEDQKEAQEWKNLANPSETPSTVASRKVTDATQNQKSQLEDRQEKEGLEKLAARRPEDAEARRWEHLAEQLKTPPAPPTPPPAPPTT